MADAVHQTSASAGTSGARTETVSTPASLVTYEQVADMIRGSEEKFGSKMTALEGSIEGKLSKLDRVPTLWQIGGLLITTALGVIALVLAILAFGGDRFDGGIQFSSSVMKEGLEASARSEEARLQAAENNKLLQDQREQMDKLLPILTEIIANQSKSKDQ